MKTWYFSETAYPDLPDPASYDSVRVTLPNRIIDPKRAADLWHRYLDEWLAAEEYGFGLMLNEHHATPTCMDPAGPIIAGILARETKTAPILILGNPVANRSDPVRVAEEMALVDVISRGRLSCGLVRGVPYEVSATNSKPISMTDRFWEAHDLIVKAWTSHDGPFSWTGEFFEHRQVNIWPRPYQQPHPPVWVATLNPTSTKKIAELGYTAATFLQGTDKTRVIFDAYRQYRHEANGEYSQDQLAYAGMVFVADNEADALAGAEQLMWYITSNKAPGQFSAPPGYMPPAARVAAIAAGVPGSPLAAGASSPFVNKTIGELIEGGLLFAGTPDDVFEQIRMFHTRVGGFGQFLMMGQAGHLGHDDTIKSMRLYAQEVAPRLTELTAESLVA